MRAGLVTLTFGIFLSGCPGDDEPAAVAPDATSAAADGTAEATIEAPPLLPAGPAPEACTNLPDAVSLAWHRSPAGGALYVAEGGGVFAPAYWTPGGEEGATLGIGVPLLPRHGVHWSGALPTAGGFLKFSPVPYYDADLAMLSDEAATWTARITVDGEALGPYFLVPRDDGGALFFYHADIETGGVTLQRHRIDGSGEATREPSVLAGGREFQGLVMPSGGVMLSDWHVADGTRIERIARLDGDGEPGWLWSRETPDAGEAAAPRPLLADGATALFGLHDQRLLRLNGGGAEQWQVDFAGVPAAATVLCTGRYAIVAHDASAAEGERWSLLVVAADGAILGTLPAPLEDGMAAVDLVSAGGGRLYASVRIGEVPHLLALDVE